MNRRLGLDELSQLVISWPGKVEAIVNVRAGDWAVGYKGKLLDECKSKADWQHFRRLSYEANALLMGRLTAQSICPRWSSDLPDRPVLLGRHTIVASGRQLHNVPEDKNGVLLVCGGLQVYKLCLLHCEAVHVTVSLPTVNEKADAYFDKVLLDKYFKLTDSVVVDKAEFRTYVQKTCYERKSSAFSL